MHKMLTISILSILFLAVSAFATGPLFKGQIVCTGGDYYYAICAAELDNDGDPDLIASDVDNNSVNVFLTQADGSFTEPASYNINGSSYAIAWGDFNGDGYNDIVVNREIGYDDLLGVLINNGDGTFKPPVDYDAYNDADDIITADFNGDDNIDILTSTHQYAELYLNNGDGTFAAAVDIAAAYNMNTGLAAADFDGDGDIDFAINNYEFDSTQVFLNDGSGGFAAGVRYPSYGAPNGLEAALLNNDAYPDLIITNNTTNKVTILINDGDGTFAAPVQYTVGSGAYHAAPGDYDNDGDIDIAVSTWAGMGASLLFNNGDGTFGAAVHYKDAESSSLAAGDFDKDGFLDLAVATGFDFIIVMYNNGDGSFYVNPGLPVGTNAWSVATGDYDNDDNVDMAVTNFTSNNVTLLLNNGDSTFNTLVFAELPAGAGPKGIAMADIDNNSDDDLIIADFSKDSITTKGIGFVTPKNYAVGDGPSFVKAAQLDNDGYFDLVVLNENSRSISVLLNDGSGGFLAAAGYPTATIPYSAALADLDGDGDIDMAIANEGSYPGYDQKTFLNDGNGSFVPGPSLPVSYNCIAVEAADIDDDGDNDLVYIGSDSRINVFMNEGSGTFTAPVVYEMSFSPFNIFIGDFDLDGDPDLALSVYWDGVIAIYFNDGNGVFGDPRLYRFGNADISGFAGADLDKDGDAELIAVSQTDATDSLQIFWNRRDLIPTDIENNDHPDQKPTRFALFQNFPNPFNPTTTIEYTVPVRAEVAITIYNVLGQTVRSLTDGPKAPGTYRINWDGRDNSGHQVSTGIYFYQIRAGDFAASKRMVLLK